VAIVLKSKPGLSSTTTLNIPTDWDPTWFRNLISNQLKGADVRNAVGSNGISVTGNISSPYATISIGGTGPVALPGPVTINTPAGTVALTVNGAAGQRALAINGSAASGLSYGLLISAGTTSADQALYIRNQSGSLNYLLVYGDGGVAVGNGAADNGIGTLTTTSNIICGSYFQTNQGTYLMASGVSFVNGAGSSAGTLTNAPAAGSPTKWIAIDDNGTVRHIPAW